MDMNPSFERPPSPESDSVEMLQEKIRTLTEENEALRNERDSERERRERAEKDASEDPLTGLYNRRGLEKAARIAMPETRKSGNAEHRSTEGKGKSMAALQLDIDKFKQINDLNGHAEGDRIIKEAAEFLVRSVRPSDIVARLGGDEFVVLFNGASERIVNKFFDPDADPPRPRLGFFTTLQGKETWISFSGGITMTEPGETANNLGDLLDRADQALYESKRAGRDRVMLLKEEPVGN